VIVVAVFLKSSGGLFGVSSDKVVNDCRKFITLGEFFNGSVFNKKHQINKTG